MDDLSLKFNNLMIQEMGFEIGPNKRLYDQDTGMMLHLDGKQLVAPGCVSGKEVQEFDPYNSTKMMSQLFSYYTDKLVQNGESTEYNVIYNVDIGNGRGRIEMRNDEDIIKSALYTRDQCKYADLILRLNGDENPNLKEFDIPKSKKTIKKKIARKEK